MKPLRKVRVRGLRGSLCDVRRSLSDLYRGLSGYERQVNDQLVQRLATLRADYNQLRKETDDLLRYADREINALKRTNTGLAREYDDLQLRVWELEQQVDELLLYIAQCDEADIGESRLISGPVEGEVLPTPDLSAVKLGIVGGHDATRREVIKTLVDDYGLKQWVEVPPTWEKSLSQRVLKGKLERCDLTVIVTGYMNHSLTNAVQGLKESGGLAGDVVLLNFRGKSGVVREILRLAAAMGATSES
ncbi:MAG: hypothetical protein AAFQ74_04930 [Cyanobacteria bacterium J06623_4]